jgi:hypothetical protein
MTAFIVSLAYDADVERTGKRNESRETFRHDVPLEIPEIERSALEPAIVIADHLGEHVIQADADGALWLPFVPPDRRGRDLPARRVPSGETAERLAQTVDEFACAIGGLRPPGHDPLDRRSHGLDSNRMNHLPYAERLARAAASHATMLPKIEESDVRRILWSERPQSERRLREAADRLRIVNGKIWVRRPEPVLALSRYREERRIAVYLDGARDYTALTCFRLDRFEELVAWATSRQGLAAVRPPKGCAPDALCIEHRFELLKCGICRRDDAREMLAGRLDGVLFAARKILSVLPALGVDAYIDLKRFFQDQKSSNPSTPALFDSLEALRAAAAGLSGLDEEGFAAQVQIRHLISPLQTRWQQIEARRYPPMTASEPAAAPAARCG